MTVSDKRRAWPYMAEEAQRRRDNRIYIGLSLTSIALWLAVLAYHGVIK